MNAVALLKQLAASVEVDVPDPHVLDPSVEIAGIVAAINSCGLDMFRKAEWPDLVKVVTLPRQGPGDFPAKSSYELPDDYGYISSQGGAIAVQDERQPFAYDAMSNMQEWISYADDGSMILHNRRIYTNDDAASVVLTYVSDHWCSAGEALAGDEDTFNVPFVLLREGAEWRWREKRGLDYERMENRWLEDVRVQIQLEQGTAP